MSKHYSRALIGAHPESFPITGGTAAASANWLMTMAASGTAFSGPWGVSVAADLAIDSAYPQPRARSAPAALAGRCREPRRASRG